MSVWITPYTLTMRIHTLTVNTIVAVAVVVVVVVVVAVVVCGYWLVCGSLACIANQLTQLRARLNHTAFGLSLSFVRLNELVGLSVGCTLSCACCPTTLFLHFWTTFNLFLLIFQKYLFFLITLFLSKEIGHYHNCNTIR